MIRTLRPETALLLCNGEPPSCNVLLAARVTGLLVAADGGANYAPALGLEPDLIIGDLDSVKPSILRRFTKTGIIRVRRQDNTDMEKALDYLRGHDVGRVFLLGATGRRMDMTLANLTVIWRYVPFMESSLSGPDGMRSPSGECR